MNACSRKFFAVLATFQPTPPYGDEHGRCQKTKRRHYFNPHPRMGMNDTPVVNFHLMHNFNPHPRMGMNLISSCILAPYFLFQPTPPHGDEHLVPAYKCQAGNFNPHPRMGMNPDSLKSSSQM